MITQINRSAIFYRSNGNLIPTNDETVKADIYADTFKLADNEYIYLKGDETTDGSYRVGVGTSAIVFEKRESGTWVEKFAIED